jgi:hypothetical protein
MKLPLTRIFHTDHNERAANPDADKEGDGLRRRLYVSYCPSQNTSLTQHPSDLTASASARHDISGLALTYDNDSQILDGAGSQLHRIYSVYALSRFLEVPYIHSPLKKLSYQGLLSLEKNETNPELISRYNTLFTIPSDIEIPKHAKILHIYKQDLSWLYSLKNSVTRSSDFLLLKLSWPFSFIRQHPEIFQHVKPISPFKRISSSIFKIVIHIRRGDLLISPEGNRMLPNSYYINLTLRIVEVLNTLGISWSCELHTEVPTKTFVVTSENSAMQTMKERVLHPVMIKQEESFFEEFNVIPHLKICNNHDPVEAIRSFATADLFIMSRSTFSYLGAILNKTGIIVYHPFWFSAPVEWIDSTHELSFHERLVAACEGWKKSSAFS